MAMNNAAVVALLMIFSALGALAGAWLTGKNIEVSCDAVGAFTLGDRGFLCEPMENFRE